MQAVRRLRFAGPRLASSTMHTVSKACASSVLTSLTDELPGGVYRCRDCIRCMACLPPGEAAERLISEFLSPDANQVQLLSQRNYQQGLNRYIRFADETGIPRWLALPLAPHAAMPVLYIQSFLVWAKERYAISTIAGSLMLSANSDWHRSKGCPLSDNDHCRVSAMFKAIKVEKGVTCTFCTDGSYRIELSLGQRPQLDSRSRADIFRHAGPHGKSPAK